MIRSVTFENVVNEYVDSILSGDMPACNTTRQAVERYVSDRARVNQDPDFPFTFNDASAAMACHFFPLILRHSKGKWARQPIHLYAAQTFWTWNIFGWEREDGTRRFRRVFISLGRKGGKSTYCAGLCLLLSMIDDEPGSEVFIAATKLEQAKIIFEESRRMVMQSPTVMEHATVQKDNIFFPGTFSVIRPLGSDKEFDGLNPHGVFFDELHAMRTKGHRAFFDTMVTGGGTRTQPLQVTITTAGDETSHLYNDEIGYVRDVLSGEVIDDAWFGVIYELDKDDDIFDESNWHKANPGLANGTPQIEYLREQAVEAKHKRSAERRFRQKNVNISVSQTGKAVDADELDACRGPLSDWSEAESVAIGIDLGGMDDLAAIGYAARFPFASSLKSQETIYRYEVKCRTFLSSKTKRDINEEPFRSWIEQGDIELVDFVLNTVKDAAIEDSFADGVTLGAIDPRNASQMCEEFELEGLDVLKMWQSCTHFNEVLIEWESAIKEGRLIVDETDPVLRWCFLNMTVKHNANGEKMPDKVTSKEKIDAAVAVLMAIRAVWVSPGRIDGPLYMS